MFPPLTFPDRLLVTFASSSVFLPPHSARLVHLRHAARFTCNAACARAGAAGRERRRKRRRGEATRAAQKPSSLAPTLELLQLPTPTAGGACGCVRAIRESRKGAGWKADEC